MRIIITLFVALALGAVVGCASSKCCCGAGDKPGACCAEKK